jgi:hypothetical protein
MSIWCAMPWPNFQWTWSEPHLQRVWLRGGKLAVVTKGSRASLTIAEEMDANPPICRPIFGCMRGWAELRQGRPDWLALTPRTSEAAVAAVPLVVDHLAAYLCQAPGRERMPRRGLSERGACVY